MKVREIRDLLATTLGELNLGLKRFDGQFDKERWTLKAAATIGMAKRGLDEIVDRERPEHADRA